MSCNVFFCFFLLYMSSGIGANCKIRIEPALFEWCGWCRNVMPEFMTPGELAQAGFNVDLDYVPLMKSTQLNLTENVGLYYSRSYKATQFIVRKHMEEGEPWLI